ncbi:Eco57I restriction-modification methylase domain-containing protein [Streptococcus australis]|uniref:Eco57I restriction-modification methylase domain-containing protein n=1 Tax=Streptococcus australis TaxID=113107 RepID=UPI00189BA50E|nr:Eco57I restriction-modification methylase domain-containing protein [Streptococcus australis]MDB8645309.1 Eco57I restriction-modification methylase domain-containing protein [Streptococcus australis]
MASNFDFLKLNTETAVLFSTINEAENNYSQKDYEGVLIRVRKVAENTAILFANCKRIKLPSNSTFHVTLQNIKSYIKNKEIVDAFFEIKRYGNNSAHELNPKEATQENALKSLEQIYMILVWFVTKYVNDQIKVSLYDNFLEPKAQERYTTAERKFIYVQTVNNESGKLAAYEGAQKIGEGTISSDDIEADWTANSEFLRKIAPKRIKQYMTTAGLHFELGWVELAYKKSTKTWFHDHDVHEVLKRSGIKHPEELAGNEWFKTDLLTAKKAIKAVKDGRSFISDVPAEYIADKSDIILRPEQNAAVEQTQKTFKKKDRMLWNAKMRFGKTLTSLELIKQEGFQRVLIMTHRPVVRDSWFEDYKKMEMAEAGYLYGSVDKGEKLTTLKSGDNPFIYFASIQYLRYNSAQANLPLFSDVDWDLIIIDEAHEGTQTELSDTVMKSLVKEGYTKILELSGTPFNLLDQFAPEQVYTWDYVMEQQAKLKWDLENPELPNPYEQLPEVQMYTFEMKYKEKFTDENKAFNFREFFRVDDKGELVYKADVRRFLDNITNPNSDTNYPFSTREYRDELRHTLWIMPGVREANAFEKLLKEHPVFGMDYNIVNVVRNDKSDNIIDASGDDLSKVRQAITDDPSQTKTITLTVRRLTTGVNVPEWTAVMFLSNTSSSTNYLQAAFRAQTPFSHEKIGMKKRCYIFDFAPDRALTVMAETAQINSGVGKKNTNQQKQAMANLLNFLPILGKSDNGMEPFNVDRMLTQIKKVYAEKAVRSGFEDDSLYNDNLLTLTADDAERFNKLNAIVGKTQKQKTPTKVTINDSGLTDEEYDQAEKAKKKKPHERSQEEKEAIEKLKEARKQQKTMISILRGVSIRIPMMIYGMDVDLSKDITIGDFIKEVDDESWKEFMPAGFTKDMFKDITKYYDAEVFIEAGRIIRQRAKSFDSLDFIERAEEIATLFGSFKNPDKETVLTPWRVVNMQIAKGIGGLNFYDDNFESMTDGATPNLHWVDTDVTDSVYHPETKIIDINAKTGLYPLHAAMSLYYQYVQNNDDNRFDADSVYRGILENNIYAIAKTPMAKTITERTLTGYKKYKTNVAYIENFSDTLKSSIEEGKKQVEEAFDKVKFDVVIGNPPYQESDNKSGNGSATPLYDKFIELSISIKPKYISLITPSVWFLGGKGLDNFRRKMLEDIHIKSFHNYVTPNDVFQNVSLRGGVNFFVWDANFNNTKYFIHTETIKNSKIVDSSDRPYRLLDLDLFISDSRAYTLLQNMLERNYISLDFEDKKLMLYGFVSERNPFGIATTMKDFGDENDDNDVKIYASKGRVGFLPRSTIKRNLELVDSYKVLTAFANNIGTDLPDDNLNTIVSEPKSACTETYLVIGGNLKLTRDTANNLSKYLKTKFVRMLIMLAKANQNGTRKTYRFVPLQSFTSDLDIDWSQSIAEINQQLYRKYELSEEEIIFIEENIKEME